MMKVKSGILFYKAFPQIRDKKRLTKVFVFGVYHVESQISINLNLFIKVAIKWLRIQNENILNGWIQDSARRFMISIVLTNAWQFGFYIHPF